MYETEIYEINSEMHFEMGFHGIEDTPENRLNFLEGMRQAWIEDASSSPEKAQYQRALQFEINRLIAVIESE